jgi:lactoylglutathione lyase
MKLNHLNLTVTDPIETQAFLAKYFGMQPMGKPNTNICFLTDENGMILSLTHVKLGQEAEVKYPATSRLGPLTLPASAPNRARKTGIAGLSAFCVGWL